eukprot:UN06719
MISAYCSELNLSKKAVEYFEIAREIYGDNTYLTNNWILPLICETSANIEPKSITTKTLRELRGTYHNIKAIATCTINGQILSYENESKFNDRFRTENLSKELVQKILLDTSYKIQYHALPKPLMHRYM